MIIGFIFSTQSLGLFFTTLVVGKLMSKPGMKKIFVVVGLLVSVFS